jgi:uncharacterized membrane protein YedE/YeeE
MFRNLFLFGQGYMLRSLALLVVTSMLLFEGARILGLLPIYPFPLLGLPSITNIIGGFFFGIGMVLAGGCVIGTLYKMGAGSLLSAVAFAGLIIGSTLYAEIHPWWVKFAKATTWQVGETVPQLAGVAPSLLIGAMVLLTLPLFYLWYKKGMWIRSSVADGYMQPWVAAIILSIIGLLSYIMVGMPMGVTTSYAKMGAFLQSLIMPDHLARLAYFKVMPLDYIHPITHQRLVGGAGASFDAIAAIQIPLVIGIVFGGTISSVLLKEFKIYYNIPVRQFLSAVTGGVIMGLASRLAPACSVWHLFGGLPILALQSLLFFAGLIPGAWVGSKILANVVVK